MTPCAACQTAPQSSTYMQDQQAAASAGHCSPHEACGQQPVEPTTGYDASCGGFPPEHHFRTAQGACALRGAASLSAQAAGTGPPVQLPHLCRPPLHLQVAPPVGYIPLRHANLYLHAGKTSWLSPAAAVRLLHAAAPVSERALGISDT